MITPSALIELTAENFGRADREKLKATDDGDLSRGEKRQRAAGPRDVALSRYRSAFLNSTNEFSLRSDLLFIRGDVTSRIFVT